MSYTVSLTHSDCVCALQVVIVYKPVLFNFDTLQLLVNVCLPFLSQIKSGSKPKVKKDDMDSYRDLVDRAGY